MERRIKKGGKRDSLYSVAPKESDSGKKRLEELKKLGLDNETLKALGFDLRVDLKRNVHNGPGIWPVITQIGKKSVGKVMRVYYSASQHAKDIYNGWTTGN